MLRFNHINQPIIDVFSWRQSSTAMMADNFFRTNWNIFFPEVNWGGLGPNYQGREFQTVSYLAALLYNVFGQQDWIGRSVAVVFGVWGVFALYQLTDRLWDNQHALLGAALMAILPGCVFIERSFLPDPAMVSLVTTSFWLLVEYLQRDKLKYLVWAAIVASLGFLTKITGLIVGIPMLYVAFTLLSRRQRLKTKYIIPIAIAAVFMLIPVVCYYLWARHLSLTYPPYHFAGSGNWVWDHGMNTWLSKGYFLSNMSKIFVHWLFSAVGFFLIIFGFFVPANYSTQWINSNSEVEEKTPDLTAIWVFHWWLIGFTIFYLIGAKELVDNPWNFHILSPAAAVLMAHAMLSFGQIWRSRVGRLAKLLVTLIALTLIIPLSQQSLASMYYPYAQESYSLGLALREVSQPSDLVVVIGNNMGDPVSIYYAHRRGWTFPPSDPKRAWNRLPEDDAFAIQLFDDLRQQGADWFGIVTEQKQNIWDNHSDLKRYIETNFVSEEENSDWTIYRIPSL